MKNLTQTLEIFIKLTETFAGSKPTFRIDHKNNCIEIVKACSGFMKLLFKNDKLVAHLNKGSISVQYFK